MNKVLKNFVGIDISKASFDVALIRGLSSENAASFNLIHRQFKQTLADYRRMICWLQQQGISVNEETLFCMEDTGLYNHGLVNFLSNASAQLWVEMPLCIKKSEEFSRESNDKIDAQKIARYAYRYQDKMQLWQPLDNVTMRLKNLIAQRDRIVKCIKQLQVPVQELASCGCKEMAKESDKYQRAGIKGLQKTVAEIEKAILDLIKTDKKIQATITMVASITGIGMITSVALHVYTRGFTSFENARQLACYCGVVPFKRKESGSSVRSKARVSSFANKKLKWLMHMCALSAIRWDNELKEYYERKKGEGKNKMSVINAVRNKLIHRVFAVTRDNRMFEKDWVRKCA